ncbi:MAG: adenylyl-sulfate kinase [Actinomycetota bacterium]|nr:adenylyl-sulfate kinase [Actinomycetota bacterium]
MTAADPSRNLTWHHGLDAATRARLLGGHGATVWLTGLSGSGKSTVAVVLERRLVEAGRPAYLLDGDNVRHGLNDDLGFSEADRTENVRRLGQVSRLLADAGVVALVPVISPFGAGRGAARAAHEAMGLRFLEVFVDTPLEECERRDPKGLYAMARRGEITGFTGIDSPYEPPLTPDLVLTPADGPPADQAERVLELLGERPGR